MTTKSYNEQLPNASKQNNAESLIEKDIPSPSFIYSIKHINMFILFLLICHIISLSYFRMSLSVLYDIYFVFLIWFPIGNTLAITIRQSKYIFYCLFNYLVLNVLYLFFGGPIFWNRFICITPYALFETFLYMSVNKEQTTRICFINIRNKYCSYIFLFTTLIFNRVKLFWLCFPLYTYVFKFYIVEYLSDYYENNIEKYQKFIKRLIAKLKAVYENCDDKRISDRGEQRPQNVYNYTNAQNEYIEDINSISKQQLMSHIKSKVKLNKESS